MNLRRHHGPQNEVDRLDGRSPQYRLVLFIDTRLPPPPQMVDHRPIVCPRPPASRRAWRDTTRRARCVLLLAKLRGGSFERLKTGLPS